MNDLLNSVDYKRHKDSKNKSIIPEFKLDAYCINLKRKEDNYNYMCEEWKDHLNLKRFIALESATKSHQAIMLDIWKNKETIQFPIAIVEDDIFWYGNFNFYWNKLKELTGIDYVCFDGSWIQNAEEENYQLEYFFKLREHRAIGFNVYYKQLFDKYESEEELMNDIHYVRPRDNKMFPFDMYFTHKKNNTKEITKVYPYHQVCKQVVSKVSQTNKQNHGKIHNKFYYDAFLHIEKERRKRNRNEELKVFKILT